MESPDCSHPEGIQHIREFTFVFYNYLQLELFLHRIEDICLFVHVHAIMNICHKVVVLICRDANNILQRTGMKLTIKSLRSSLDA